MKGYAAVRHGSPAREPLRTLFLQGAAIDEPLDSSERTGRDGALLLAADDSSEERRLTAYALVTIVFEVSVVTALVLVAATRRRSLPRPRCSPPRSAARGRSATATAASRRGPRRRAARAAAHAGMRTLFCVLLAFGGRSACCRSPCPCSPPARRGGGRFPASPREDTSFILAHEACDMRERLELASQWRACGSQLGSGNPVISSASSSSYGLGGQAVSRGGGSSRSYRGRASG